jgi:tetratricopeptide (TPR) repeat protein
VRNPVEGNVSLYRRALAIYESIYGDDHWRVASVLVAIAMRLGPDRVEESKRAFEQARTIYEKWSEVEHPELANSLAAQSTHLLMNREVDEGLAMSRRALAMTERFFPAGHPRVVGALASLASALSAHERHGEALRYSARAALLVCDESSVPYVMSIHGRALEANGRLPAAVEAFERALESSRSLPNFDLTTDTISRLGEVLLRLKDYDRARRHFERALGATDSKIARALALFGLARASWPRRQLRTRAIAHAREALSVFASLATSPGHMLVNPSTERDRVSKWLEARDPGEEKAAQRLPKGARALTTGPASPGTTASASLAMRCSGVRSRHAATAHNATTRVHDRMLTP